MLLEAIFLAVAVPTGVLIAHFTKDETPIYKKWFQYIVILSAISSVLFYLYRQPSIALVSAFIAIATFISYVKSHNNKL